MQRFLSVGAAHIHVLEVHAHDPRDARRLHGVLDSLAPERVLLDMSPADAAARLAGTDRVHPFVAAELVVHGRFGTAQAWAAFEGAYAWGRATGVPVELLSTPSPPDLGWWARRRLARLVKHASAQMGTHAPSAGLLHAPPGAASLDEGLADLRNHVASQTPSWWDWLRRRHEASAQHVVASAQARPGDTVVVACAPDGGRLADAVQAAAIRTERPRDALAQRASANGS